MDYQEIIFEKKDTVAILTLNRPEIRNALSSERMASEIVEAFQIVQKDKEIRVVILTGSGSAFSSGGNIKDMHEKKGIFEGDPLKIRENYRTVVQQIPRAFHNLDVPVVAAVNGPAIGAGCDLACMCDIRLASENALFGETFAAAGVVSGVGGAFFLPRIVGFAKASELMLTCRIIDANEALSIGLVSEIVKHDELIGKSMELAKMIAKQPPTSTRLTKRLLQMSQKLSLDEVLELSAAYQGLSHHTPEHSEALKNLLRK